MSKSARVVIFILMLASALLIVSLAQAQDTTPQAPLPATEAATPAVTLAAGSPAQLKLHRPLLGMQLMDSQNAPNFYQESTLGGGDLYITLGGTCVPGYTTALASLGMVWIGASGPVQIGFNATDPAAATSVVMWDQLKQQWWCNQGFSRGNYIEFNNLDQGIYFVWVMTQANQTVQGNVFVRAKPAQ